MKTIGGGRGGRIAGAAPAALCLALLLASGAAPSAVRAQDMPAVDGDEALRCAVARAVDMALVRQLHDIVAAGGEGLALMRDLAAGKAGSDGDALAMLVGLGLVTGGEGSKPELTPLGRKVLDLDDGATDSPAARPLTLDVTLSVTVDQPGALAHLRLDAAGSGGETIVVTVTPHAAGGDGCIAGFDPVVRASLPGLPDIEAVARGEGPERIATLFLHHVADGAGVELAIGDVVGAPGSFDIAAHTWPSVAPAAGDGVPLLSVADGPLAYQDIRTDGDRAVLAFSIEEGYEIPTLSVRGLAGAQPGVTVYAADAFGEAGGPPIYRSSFAPIPDATVELGGALGPGFYAATVEELGGRPATFLVAFSASGSGAAFRTSGTLEIGGESPQVLGSDLAFHVEEQGWYAFSSWSYDEIDPVMTLLDGAGESLYYSDDAAFGLHPLIIAELAPGDYSLAIDGFDGATGDLTLGAWRFEPQVLDLGTVALAQQIANDLAQPNFNAYLIPITANELVDIDIEGLGAEFDSTLALYDTVDMTVWNADDDGGVGYGSRIIDSFDGLNLLTVVSSYDGSRGGAFSISAVDHAAMENLEETAATVAPGGPEVAGRLDSESDIAWFRIAPLSGSHTVTVESEAMPYLGIDLFARTADGYAWLDTMEGYEGLTELSFEGDPVQAIYVLVRNPSGEGTGDFRVSLD